MTKEIMKEIEEVLETANEFENTELDYFPPEGEGDEPKELPEKPTPERIRGAMFQLRYQTAQALRNIGNLFRDQHEEIARLRGHRHDTTKAYSGRPEL